ncbi:hypothetical protein C7S18_02920 [Ahniella affigens]|uniref:O-GlcNAc transferase C-terminal domain-containing protein n=1 Tax=Ahniella affigens TaxID=2021234 RepID=A0A2P1PN06_9GAMM|nr:hypothetical protein [Ahniella affigens]AVP96207.1 hypothetical protein C7S18_02920 [Ahniella affigens]
MRDQALALLKAGHAAQAQRLLTPLLANAKPDPDLLKLGINAALMQDDLDQAWQWFEALQSRLPDLDQALARVGSKLANRRGARFEQQERGLPAQSAYRAALLLWPENPDARANLHRLAHQTATLTDLLPSPELASAISELSQQLQRVLRGEPPEPTAPPSDSLTDWQRYAELAGADAPMPPTLGLLPRIAAHLSLPMVYESHADLAAWRHRYQLGMQELCADTAAPKPDRDGLKQLAWSNFYLAYQGADDRDLQRQYGTWLSQMAAALRPELSAPRSLVRSSRPKVGLISGHWYQSTVGSYFASWIGALATAPVQVDVLALAPNLDAFTRAIVPHGVRLHELPADPDRAAELLHAAQYDLLIYPELGIDTRLLALAALPLANLQWAAWGHPVTTGLPTIQRYLSVASMEPPGASAHYTEPLSLLPGIGTQYRAPGALQHESREALGLPPGPLLVCPQSPFKIHPDQDTLFAETLAAIPESRLLLFASERPLALAKLRRRLAQLFAAYGLDPARVIVHPMVSRPRFLSILAVCDLMLDTCHWSGGNTALDTLFVGLPMVALEGAFMRGRQSAAMLGLAGLAHAVAPNRAQYADLARQLIATDRAAWRQAFAAVQDDFGALPALREQVLAGLV